MVILSHSIDEAAAQITGSGLPVLVLDTCILLDVVRAPFRDEVPNKTVARAVQLHDSTAAVELVVASIVPREIDDNLAGVSTELRRHCERLITHASDADTACAAINLQRQSALSRSSYTELILELPRLAEQLVNRATVLQAEDAIELKAHRRTVDRRPPSSRIDQGKDCQIYEEMLDLARRARASNHAEKIAFCTSNTRDYCEQEAVPHPDLAAELATVNVTFTTNLPWACAELGL